MLVDFQGLPFPGCGIDETAVCKNLCVPCVLIGIPESAGVQPEPDLHALVRAVALWTP
jgi:hypothetical protein